MASERTSEVLAGSRPWHVEAGDVLDYLAGLPDDSADLVFGSPPYAGKWRRYGAGHGNNNLKAQDWVDWMVAVVLQSLRVSRGLTAFVIDGGTQNFTWDCTPALLMADLHRAGVVQRKPHAYVRTGVPGGGRPDWFKNNWEFVLCCTRGGQLPWSDPLATAKPPIYQRSGPFSNRRADGTRSHRDYTAPTKANPGNVLVCELTVDDILRLLGGYLAVAGTAPAALARSLRAASDADALFPWCAGIVTGLCSAALLQLIDGVRVDAADVGGDLRAAVTQALPHLRPALAAALAHQRAWWDVLPDNSSDVLACVVGGGKMGSKLAHDNEAPFPEPLPERFVRSCCPPGGLVVDPFCGSGTTLAVAVRWGRRALGCDLRPAQACLTEQRVAAVVVEPVLTTAALPLAAAKVPATTAAAETAATGKPRPPRRARKAAPPGGIVEAVNGATTAFGYEGEARWIVEQTLAGEAPVEPVGPIEV